jgi:hypothetical protein
MRTSPSIITKVEKDAYNAFCQQNNILNDESPAAVQNGNHIGGYICTTWGEDIDARTLPVALEQLRDRLTFIPPEQVEVVEILSKLDQGQRDLVASWLAKQHRLETDGPKGFSNVSVLCAWLLNRRYPISEEGLTMALGNVQNSSHRKIWWKELPKADRSIGPGGRINHALVNKSEEGFMPRSQTNRTARQIAEDNRPKSETPVAPVSINVEYQSKAESLQGRTHGQTDQARKLFVMVPGTSTIDWQQTHAAREKFLNTQVPLVRR